MSRASPGRYALHEFAKNVYDVSVTDAGGTAADRSCGTTRIAGSWSRGGAAVRFAYTLFGIAATAPIRRSTPATRTSTCRRRSPGRGAWRSGRWRCASLRPRGSGWRVATQLIAGKDSLVWAAPDMAYFMDSPTEVSGFALRSWTVTGKAGRADTIRIALHHEGTDAELDAYADAARKVVAEQVGSSARPRSYDHGIYTFLADYLPGSTATAWSTATPPC